MKKILLSFFIILLLILSGCSKSDTKQAQTSTYVPEKFEPTHDIIVPSQQETETPKIENNKIEETPKEEPKKECSHTGGSAICVSGPICDLCGEEYGEKDPNTHAELKQETTHTEYAYSPTCLKNGYGGRLVITCGLCGKVLQDDPIIFQAYRHSFKYEYDKKLNSVKEFCVQPNCTLVNYYEVKPIEFTVQVEQYSNGTGDHIHLPSYCIRIAWGFYAEVTDITILSGPDILDYKTGTIEHSPFSAYASFGLKEYTQESLTIKITVKDRLNNKKEQTFLITGHNVMKIDSPK